MKRSQDTAVATVINPYLSLDQFFELKNFGIDLRRLNAITSEKPDAFMPGVLDFLLNLESEGEMVQCLSQMPTNGLKDRLKLPLNKVSTVVHCILEAFIHA